MKSKKLIQINLIEKYRNSNIALKFESFKNKINGFTDVFGNLKKGDIVKFISGYDNNAEFTTEILGFDSVGNVFVLKDSYWATIDINKIIKC